MTIDLFICQFDILKALYIYKGTCFINYIYYTIHKRKNQILFRRETSK